MRYTVVSLLTMMGGQRGGEGTGHHRVETVGKWDVALPWLLVVLLGV